MTDIAGWLPDGEHIVVSRRVPGGTLLQTLNIHTGVLSDKAEINNLKGGFVTLSPDGSQIAGGGGPSSIGLWRGIPYNPAYMRKVVFAINMTIDGYCGQGQETGAQPFGFRLPCSRAASTNVSMTTHMAGAKVHVKRLVPA